MVEFTRDDIEVIWGKYFLDANGVIDPDVDLEDWRRNFGLCNRGETLEPSDAPNICLFSAFITLLFARSR